MILRSYPDYGKTPDEYILTLISVLAGYPVAVQARLADLKIGLPARCEFVPTVAKVVELADEFLKADNELIQFQKRFPLNRKVLPRPNENAPFIPYAKLWEAFANEPHLLTEKTFDRIQDAARALAMHGRESAWRILGGK